MHELDRITQALATSDLDEDLFERCAQDLLTPIYPGLSPIPGGTDWGRDADIAHGAGPVMRLLVTASRDVAGVKKNVARGIDSMKAHDVARGPLVVATPARLSNLERVKLSKFAEERGADIHMVHERDFFASQLRRDGEWRSRLLGLSADPISLVRRPWDLAQSLGADLPLVGRAAELASLADDPAKDVILHGVPGSGKTRLMSELDDVYFVDTDAPIATIVDAIRWAQPTTLVIDDAGRSDALLRELERFRLAEEGHETPFRLIAACYPHEVDQVHTWLSRARTQEVGFLSRKNLDEMLVAAGVQRESLRTEILDQSEGRPGWAVSLASMVIEAGSVRSLYSGQALLGEARRYLQRAALAPAIADQLAVVAAIGGISEREIPQLATSIGLPAADAADHLNMAAKSGLLDVGTFHSYEDGGEIRVYTVRPPMLGNVLVADRAFESDAPAVDLLSLADRWPHRLIPLAYAAVESARLGSTRARPVAESLFGMAVPGLGIGDLTPDRTELVERYCLLGESEAQHATGLCRKALDDFRITDLSEPWLLEPVHRTAYLAAKRYLLREGLELLLDASTLDTRPTNPNPGHPLRLLADLTGSFHPDFPLPRQERELLLDVANEWLATEPSPERWRVWAEAMTASMSLHLRATPSMPGNPYSIRWIETVVTPDQMEAIVVHQWPKVIDHLDRAPADVVRAALETIRDWLIVGNGHDQPFGRSHPDDSIEAAKALGEVILKDLAPIASRHVGLRATLEDIAESFGVALENGEEPDELAPFFAPVLRRSDWQTAEGELRARIEGAVATWDFGSRDAIMTKLGVLRDELALTNLRWPDRLYMAFEAMTDTVDPPLDWSDAAFEAGLYPAAEPLLIAALRGGSALGETRVTRQLADPAARWTTLAALLVHGGDEDLPVVLEALATQDYRLIETLMLRDEVSEDRRRLLLVVPAAEVRGSVAAAMLAKSLGDDDWEPGVLEDEWLEAIAGFDPSITPGFADHDAELFMTFMARHYPETLTAWVEESIERSKPLGTYYSALPHGAWRGLRLLPHDQKDELWGRLGTDPGVYWLLAQYLTGDDLDWLSHAVEQELMDPETALSAYNALGTHPPIEAMARILVPRGLDPRAIASLAEGGTWVGPRSERYEELIREFEDHSKSEDESVAAMGAAGIEIFTIQRDRALAEEKIREVRGDL